MSTHGGGGRDRGGDRARSGGLANVQVFELDANDMPGESAADSPLRTQINGLIGHSLTAAEIGSLVGGQEGDHVILRAGQLGPGSVFIGLVNPQSLYQASRTLVRASDGALVMHNKDIEVTAGARGRGLGTRIFATQVAGLVRQGVDRIETYAAGYGPRARTAQALAGIPSVKNGYYTWPRLGYNANINPVALGLPHEFDHVTTLAQLFRTAAGRQAWRDYGSSMDMTFDLHPGSISMLTLQDYLNSRSGR